MPENWLPHAYTRLDNCKSPILADIAASIEPIAFSKYMLKALHQKKSTAADFSQKLCQILEYSSGFDCSRPLVGDLRHSPSLLKLMQNMSVQRGRRGSTLRLPPTWGQGQDGVYELEADDRGDIFVIVKASSLKVRIPTDMLLQNEHGKPIPIASLGLDSNWSEQKATIVGEGCSDTILVASFSDLAVKPLVQLKTEEIEPKVESVGLAPAVTTPKIGRRPSWHSPNPK
jgi:hypothetical protein